jgi:hypothetical protein
LVQNVNTVYWAPQHSSLHLLIHCNAKSRAPAVLERDDV